MYISCVIPTYNEDGYLFQTLSMLSQQTAVRNRQCEIILSDFDPYQKRTTYNILSQFLQSYPAMTGQIKILDVPRKGIGYARQRGCDVSNPNAPVLCNMDGDCYYATNDGIEQMARPIIMGNALMTACDNWIDDGLFADMVYNPIMAGFNASQAIAPAFLTRYEPGSCILKKTVYDAGGIADTKQSELIPIVNYIAISDPLALKNVAATHIIKSARRAKSIMNPNNLGKTGNYDYAFR